MSIESGEYQPQFDQSGLFERVLRPLVDLGTGVDDWIAKAALNDRWDNFQQGFYKGRYYAVGLTAERPQFMKPDYPEAGIPRVALDVQQNVRSQERRWLLRLAHDPLVDAVGDNFPLRSVATTEGYEYTFLGGQSEQPRIRAYHAVDIPQGDLIWTRPSCEHIVPHIISSDMRRLEAGIHLLGADQTIIRNFVAIRDNPLPA